VFTIFLVEKEQRTKKTVSNEIKQKSKRKKKHGFAFPHHI